MFKYLYTHKFIHTNKNVREFNQNHKLSYYLKTKQFALKKKDLNKKNHQNNNQFRPELLPAIRSMGCYIFKAAS